MHAAQLKGAPDFLPKRLLAAGSPHKSETIAAPVRLGEQLQKEEIGRELTRKNANDFSVRFHSRPVNKEICRAKPTTR
jgi:hypothetical protein